MVFLATCILCVFFCVQQKFTMDTAYYIVRELMNTERTYKKDLEVIALVSFVCVCVCVICVTC